MLILDENWTFESDTEKEFIPSLTARSVEMDCDYALRRNFWLDMTDYCVNYVLHLDSAPLGSEIVVNGQAITRVTVLPFDLDITMYVTLEDNELTFQVPPHASGCFAGVYLRPIPCD